MGTEPYRETSVPVERSKTQIRDALKRAGARGMQLEEGWDAAGKVETVFVRFLWPTDAGAMLRVRFEAKPLPADSKINADQRERQAWRGLAWYIESLTKAATFGLVPFEAVFLAYFEDPNTGKTIGEAMIPGLESGRMALPAGES